MLPLLEHDDHVGGEHGADALGDEEDGAVAHQLADRVLDARLGGDVERARRVVEDQDPRPADERARDREALALPAGEVRAAPLDLAAVAVGAVLDERRGLGGAWRR